MSSPTDDLGPLLVPPPSGQGLRYGQGRIITWNTETFENQVEWLGVTLTNLPIMAGVDALAFRANDIVGLLGWAPGAGAGSWWILGKIIIPGSAAAEQSIEFLRSGVAQQIARQVLAAAMFSNSVPLSEGSVTDPGSTYVAADGPILSNIEISDSGTCLVLITSRINVQINQPLGVSASGWMSFRITGATTREPSDEESLNTDIFGPAADVIASTIGATRLVLVEGLNPGVHTIEARYRSEGVDPVPQHAVNFTSRNLTVMAL